MYFWLYSIAICHDPEFIIMAINTHGKYQTITGRRIKSHEIWDNMIERLTVKVIITEDSEIACFSEIVVF